MTCQVKQMIGIVGWAKVPWQNLQTKVVSRSCFEMSWWGSLEVKYFLYFFVFLCFPYFRGNSLNSRADLGRPKYQNKMWYLTKPFFEDPGWERLKKLKYRNVCHFRCSWVLHTLRPPFQKLLSICQLGWRYEEGNPPNIGWYVWAKLSRRVENRFATICLWKPKKTWILSRKFAGISRKFAGISRKFADRCFNHFKTNISSMYGHGPRISRTCLSIFFSTEPIPRIHGAQTYQRTRLWVPQLGKIIYRIFIVLSQFLFSIAFFRSKMVHRVFFWHLGFAGTLNLRNFDFFPRWFFKKMKVYVLSIILMDFFFSTMIFRKKSLNSIFSWKNIVDKSRNSLNSRSALGI